MPGHSGSKNGVASLAYVPGIDAVAAKNLDGRDKPGHDAMSLLHGAARLEQEPGAPLRAVDEVLQQPRGRRILVFFRELMTFAHGRRDHLVVGHQFAQHLVGRDKRFIVVLDVLQLGNVADGAERGAADVADALGDVVGRSQNLLGLLVEQQVIVAEVRTAHVPMEILGLEVERKRIGQDLIELGRERADGVVGKIGSAYRGMA